MSRNNTGNPLGSFEFLDFEDNVKNLDVAVNTEDRSWVDRFGKERLSWGGLETDFQNSQDDREQRFQDFLNSSGYAQLGDYAAGIEITKYNQIFRHEGEWWRAAATTELPYTTTGDWATEGDNFVGIGDALLRQELADPTGLIGGSFLVGRSEVVIQSVADFHSISPSLDKNYSVRSHFIGTGRGGGVFFFSPETPKTKHNGGTVISPTVPPYNTEDGISGYINGEGEIDPSGTGCFIRKIINEEVSLFDFGALPGHEDSTAAIQKILAETRSNDGTGTNIGDIAVIPEGLFRFGGPITIGSDQRIRLSTGTVLEQIPGTMTQINQALFNISGQERVTIEGNGAVLRGVKNEATEGEGRNAVSLYSAKKVTISDLNVENVSADGFLIAGGFGDGTGPSEDIEIARCTSDNAGRNGFSVVNVKRLLLDRCGALNTKPNGMGASSNGPWAGFDIENDPDRDHFLEDVTIRDCWSESNQRAGMQFTMPYTPNPISVVVDGFRSKLDGYDLSGGTHFGGIYFAYESMSTISGNNSGSISISNITIEKPFGSAIRYRNWSSKNVPVSINGVTIIDVGHGEDTNNINRCGLWADSSGAGEFLESKGNFTIEDVKVFDNNGQMIRPVWAVGTAGAPIIAEIKDVFSGGHSNEISQPLRALVEGGVSYSTDKIIRVSSPENINPLEVMGVIVSFSGSGNFVVPDSSLCFGNEITLHNGSGNSIVITSSGGNFSSSTYATYTQSGTQITLESGQLVSMISAGTFWLVK